MDEATIALIIQFAMQYGIPAAKALVALFQKANPTQADFDAVWAVAQTPFDQGLNPGALKP